MIALTKWPFGHFIKKTVVILPSLFIIAIIVYEAARYGLDMRQMLNVTLNLLPLIIFNFYMFFKRTPRHLPDAIVQASFFVYIFGVMLETIFYIPFKEILLSMVRGDWLMDMVERLGYMTGMFRYTGFNAFGINPIPFRKFFDYSLLHRQVIGNLIMLFPLGFYLPLLYKQIDSFPKLLKTALLVSLGIETTQLFFTLIRPMNAFYYRVFDIDDILLNTVGACIGYAVFLGLAWFIRKVMQWFKEKFLTSSDQKSSPF